MATKYYSGPPTTMNNLIDSLGMVNADSLVIQGGATVTCDASPADISNNPVMLGNIFVRDGVFHINGVGASNPIIYCGEYARDFRVEGNGLLKITGDWWVFPTVSNGAANQTFDFSTYFNDPATTISNAPLPAVWVETGRRIEFDPASTSGIPPEVGDWLAVSTNHEIYGVIESVGTFHIVVRYLTGSVAPGDEIEIHKIVDNNGPDYQKSWKATVTAADTLEPDVWQAFGNAYQNNVDYLPQASKGAGGFVFSHDPATNNVIFGDGVNGFIPPNGARIRTPNVMINNATVADFTAGNVTYSSSSSSRFGLYTPLGGDLVFDKVLFGTAGAEDSFAESASFKFVGTTSSVGILNCLSHQVYEDCVMVSYPTLNTFGRYNNYPVLRDQTEGGSATRCMRVCYNKLDYIGPDSAIGTTYTDCLYIGASSGGFRAYLSTDCTFANCTVFGGRAIYSQNSNNVVVTNARQQVGKTPSDIPVFDATYITQTTGIDIFGLEFLHGNYSLDSLYAIFDSHDVRIRGFHWIDDKQIGGEETLYCSGVCSNVSAARIWRTGTNPNEFWTVVNSVKNVKLQNVSSDYDGEVELRGVDCLIRGLHSGAGALNSITGVEVDFSGVYGADIHDVFRSDTTGQIFWVALPGSSAKDYEIVSGAPKFNKGGRVSLEPMDEFIITQTEYSYGHINFTGVVTRGRHSGTTADGVNEWGTSVDAFIQYDLNDGNGWNGVWIDVTDAAALQAIPDFRTGIRLKIRLVCNQSIANVTALTLHTTTSLQAQSDNLAPIDQVVVPLFVKAIDAKTLLPVSGARIRLVTDIGGPIPAGTEIFQAVTNSNGEYVLSGYQYIGDQPITGVVRRGTNPPYYKEGRIIGTITNSGFSITVPLVEDT